MSYAQRPWPTHPDGSPRPLGDMRPAERLAFLDREPSAALEQPHRPQPNQPAQPLMTEADNLVAALMRAAFASPREPRSAYYLVGVRAALLRQAAGTPVACRWDPGSVERDAFWAGVEEGNALWKHHGAEMQVAVQWQRSRA